MIAHHLEYRTQARDRLLATVPNHTLIDALIVDYTENARLLERFRLADPDTLIVTQQFEDSGSFDGTAGRIMTFARGADHVYPYDCDPTYGVAIDTRQGPDVH
jgi:hypothetical protein